MSMTRTVHHVARLVVLVGVTGLLLLGCSADPRPLEEAVEASNLDLAQLIIESDEITGTEVTLNPGETIQFSLRGLNTAGEEVPISNIDRRWYVTDPAVASINGSGFFTALANGPPGGPPVSIGVRLGGIVAVPVTITVSDSQLIEITNIDGPTALTECKSSSAYTAQGTYEDGSVRELRNVEWSIAAGSSGRLLESSPTEAVVGGLAPGQVTLQATSAGITGTRQLTVEAGLRELTIEPETIEVETHASLPLAARAKYTDDSSATVTRLVTWSVNDSLPIATISNEPDMEGVLRGVDTGLTDVTAMCGDQSVNKTISVITPTVIERLEVDPNDNPIELRLNGNKQLIVTAFSTGNAEFAVTNQATYEVTLGSEYIAVDGSGNTRGDISAVAVGSAVLKITYRGAIININVRVL